MPVQFETIRFLNAKADVSVPAVRTVTLTVPTSATGEGWGAPTRDVKVSDVKTFPIAAGWTEEQVRGNLGRGQRDGPDLLIGKNLAGEMVALYAPGLGSKVSRGDAVTLEGQRYEIFATEAGMNVGVERAWAAIPALLGGIREAASDQRLITSRANNDQYFQYLRVPPNSVQTRRFDERGKEIE